MASGFKINRQGIRKMSQELEKEFAKHPIRVPLEADSSGVSLPSATTINNYTGPVVTINGDNAQITWGNRNAHQMQQNTQQVAPGYEELARLLTDVLANLSSLSLDETDENEVRANADTVLKEVVKLEPDKTIVRRGITLIKGFLAPIVAGVSQATTVETVENVRQIIGMLAKALPF